TRPDPMTWTVSITIALQLRCGCRAPRILPRPGLGEPSAPRHAAFMRVYVTLLGGFAAEADGASVRDAPWRLRKTKELVKLLALAGGHRLHREQAMDALWPDRGPDSAGNNLNQA